MTVRWSMLMLLLPLTALADDAAELDVTPLLCIVDERSPVCELTFNIAWRTNVNGNYCVRVADEDDTVRCWENAEQGDTTDARDIDETFSYRLHNATDDDASLAEATVEVVQKAGDDRRRRRRTRHVWDIL